MAGPCWAYVLPGARADTASFEYVALSGLLEGVECFPGQGESDADVLVRVAETP